MAATAKILLGVGALLLFGGDDDDAPAPPDDGVIIDPNTGLPVDIQVYPGTVVGPFEGPGGEEPGVVLPPVDVGPSSLVDVFNDLLTPTPTPGGLWQITQGTNLSNALEAAYGFANAQTYQAVTESQYNWGLYAVEGTAGTLWSRVVDDALGTVTSAWFPMMESASQAITQQTRLPQRTVLWNKGSNGQVQPRKMSDLQHPLAGTKGYGAIYFPVVESFGAGRLDPLKNPMALFNAAGTTPESWDPWTD